MDCLDAPLILSLTVLNVPIITVKNENSINSSLIEASTCIRFV